ncbi:MAG: hypothetical protein KDI78_01385 [Xanthomonadales bacterium]|nr:hypothetical protein [Xanthomonadales bacterium]
MAPFSSSRSRAALGWTALAFAWVTMLAWAFVGTFIGDEWVHWRQIQRFVHGDYRIFDEFLTNIPGYHWLITAILAPFGIDELGPVRAITALMTLASAWIFFRIRSRLHPVDAQRATAQFFFLPTMFVYGFLAYTDVPALLFLLGAMLATLHKRHRLSALLMLGSMSIRQNNVLWVVFLAFYAAWPMLEGIRKDTGLLRWESTRWRHSVVDLWAVVWPYMLAVLCFCVYWAWNGSISYSSAQSQNAHPDFRPDIGNPVYLLATAAVFFPLQMLAGWRRLFTFGMRWRGAWIWLMPLAVFGLYTLLYKVRHPFNFVTTNLHNQWLQLVAQGGLAWWVFGALATVGFCGLVFQRHVVTQGWLWLPFSLVFVAASWLIEPRYTIVPLVMFLALRQPAGAWAERLTLAAWVILSGWLAWNGFDHRFML